MSSISPWSIAFTGAPPHCDLRDTVADQVVEIGEFQEALPGQSHSFTQPAGIPTVRDVLQPPAIFLFPGDNQMNGVIYIVGLIVVVMFILSFLGLR